MNCILSLLDPDFWSRNSGDVIRWTKHFCTTTITTSKHIGQLFSRWHSESPIWGVVVARHVLQPNSGSVMKFRLFRESAAARCRHTLNAGSSLHSSTDFIQPEFPPDFDLVPKQKLFSCTLVPPHFTPVTRSLSGSEFRTSVASRLASLFYCNWDKST